MPAPQDVMDRLDKLARELDKHSTELAEVERKLEPLEAFWQELMDDKAVGYQERYEKDGVRVPSKDMQERLARRSAPPEVIGKRRTLLGSRERLKQRLQALRTDVSAQQTLMRALRDELSATR